MKRIQLVVLGVMLLVSLFAPLYPADSVLAAPIAGETFTGTSTQANQWLSGGTPAACLTAAGTSVANSIPACSGGPINASGSGVLRLTSNTNNQSGFAIYNTPVSASDGLDIEFDMFQYGGNGADGIAFFLIDGAASPTVPGALGGSLGYSSNSSNSQAGIVGGYVGIGFDRFGNFSHPTFGTNGPGRIPNSITVRGSAASGYKFVTTTPANGALAVEAASSRATAKRHVRITVSTNNIMNVAVNYFGSNGLETEISNINLNTINGAGTLPASFKFGFAASTGGQNNYHEISGLAVSTLKPNVSVTAGGSGQFMQGGAATVTLNVANDAGAEETTGDIMVTDTIATGMTPISASGTGWSCTISGQIVTCSRPGSGANALPPGASTPPIAIEVSVNVDAPTSVLNTVALVTPDNSNGSSTDSDTFTIANGSNGDTDGVFNVEESSSPNGGDANNDGLDDWTQSDVTSLMSRFLEWPGCCQP